MDSRNEHSTYCNMQDTTPEMYQKQLAIIFSKSERERAAMGIDMIDFAYNTVKNSILSEMPDLSDRALTVEIFKRFYQNDFSPAQLEEIAAAMMGE